MATIYPTERDEWHWREAELIKRAEAAESRAETLQRERDELLELTANVSDAIAEHCSKAGDADFRGVSSSAECVRILSRQIESAERSEADLRAALTTLSNKLRNSMTLRHIDDCCDRLDALLAAPPPTEP